jgi:hypothetical protein
MKVFRKGRKDAVAGYAENAREVKESKEAENQEKAVEAEEVAEGLGEGIHIPKLRKSEKRSQINEVR